MTTSALLDIGGRIHYGERQEEDVRMTINRRDLLVSSVALGATYGLGVSVALAADEPAPAKAPAGEGFAAAAAECVRVGEECLQHCLALLARGDTALGDCAQSVQQMLGVCRAVGPLVYGESKHLGAFAKLCAAVCADCETACRKHESHHAVCKRCAEACAKTVAEARKIAA
jgi:Cys-rich four helix bundle protein (predicted Tat secretion target)